MYSSIMNSLLACTVASYSYLGFAREIERVISHLFFPKVSALSITPCRGLDVARELRVERANLERNYRPTQMCTSYRINYVF